MKNIFHKLKCNLTKIIKNLSKKILIYEIKLSNFLIKILFDFI